MFHFFDPMSSWEKVPRKTWQQKVQEFIDYWVPRPGTLRGETPPPEGLFCMEFADATVERGTLHCCFLMATGRARPAIGQAKIPNVSQQAANLIRRILRRQGAELNVSKLAGNAVISRAECYSITGQRSRGGKGKIKVVSKETLVQLALALQATLGELEELLRGEGYCLSPYLPFDCAVRRCFDEERYGYDDVIRIFRECGCEAEVYLPKWVKPNG